jgi:integrase
LSKTVQDILGHADIETTLNDYGHVLDEMKVSAAGRLNSILAEIIKENTSQYNWQIH